MGIRADGFQVMLVGKIGIRAAGKAFAQYVAHRDHNVLVPQKAMPPPRPKVAHAQPRYAAQTFHLFPQPRLGTRIKNIELKFAQFLQAGPCLQLVDHRERVNLPHRRLGPRALEAQRELPILHVQLKI